ncbi:MAG: tRNA glutamyl-Q(34) synthetase GluQRS [Proteobacteria bacterium]|jgi:glutamyl-tRNA synthetase|nr:tRNA glutamyl-Q(34) synthetase GluQRS [Pseudomonadota bacterium]
MNSVGRYAPSPSGPLHLGNLRTALFSWLQARWCGATFVLRMDDLDTPRMRSGMGERAIDDLKWLGIDWDAGPFVQSECHHYYQQAFEQLKQMGLLYKCVCSRKEWQAVASAPHGKARLYPGTCREPDALQKRRLDDSVQFSWRFRVENAVINFEDRIHGATEQDLAREVGDFVVRRADGVFSYQLASVVDDARMHVSHVLRGADLLDSTPRQIALIKALNYTVPEYWHVPLISDISGSRMAKRDGSDSLAEMRQQGLSRADIIARMFEGLQLAAQIPFGSPQAILESWNPEELISVSRLAVTR